MLTHRGNKTARIVIVGDCPSFQEIYDGRAFTNQQAGIINALLAESGFDPKDCCYVSIGDTAIKSADKKKLKARDFYEMAEDTRNFINAFKRTLIIALGNQAAQGLGVLKAASMPARMSGRVLPYEEFNAPVICTTHSFILQKEPEKSVDFLMHMGHAKAHLDGRLESQAPMYIHDITSPDELRDLIPDFYGLDVAYDFEATDKSPDTAQPTTITLAPDHQIDGKGLVFFLPFKDKLVDLWDEATYEDYKTIFRDLFRLGRNKINFVAWNATYDDWLAERWLGTDLPGSTYDAMWMKWVVDNGTPNDLKTSTGRLQGYIGYDDRVDELVGEVASRRGKVLVHEDDFKCLDWLGIEPDRKPSGAPVWPKGLDKKACAYALLPLDEVRVYNSYDSLYTLMNKQTLDKRIKAEGLDLSNELRHRIGRWGLRAEQTGFLTDVEFNRNASVELSNIVETCTEEVRKLVGDETFNPDSQQHLNKELFGEPILLPHINPIQLYKEYDRKSVIEVVDNFHNKFYGDYKMVTSLLETGELNMDALSENLRNTFTDTMQIFADTVEKPVYPYGKYKPTVFTKTGAPSTGRVVLESLYQHSEDPLLSLILMQRKASKLKSTFIDGVYTKLDRLNVLHGRLNVIGTRSGRLSSSGPNMQNLPAYLRGQFIAPEGYTFVNFDLKSAEVYTIAALSQDPGLFEALAAQDMHKANAAKIYKKAYDDVTKEERRASKTILFGIIYGMGEFKLGIALGISQEEARRMIDEFFEAFPRLKEWLDLQIELAKQEPYYTYTPFGTRRSTKNILSSDLAVAKHAQNIACNHPVQGGAGELVLWQICDIMDEVLSLDWDVKFVNSTHDSGTFCTPHHMVEKMYELIEYHVGKPAPVKPLDTIKFQADIDHGTYWYQKPDVRLAIDPDPDKSIFLWDLIKSEETLDREELAELQELELANAS